MQSCVTVLVRADIYIGFVLLDQEFDHFRFCVSNRHDKGILAILILLVDIVFCELGLRVFLFLGLDFKLSKLFTIKKHTGLVTLFWAVKT